MARRAVRTGLDHGSRRDADGSVDPNDNDLLGQAQASLSSLLVTGDKPHLLSMVRVGPARVVVTARTLVLRISVIADAGFSVIADGVSA